MIWSKAWQAPVHSPEFGPLPIFANPVLPARWVSMVSGCFDVVVAERRGCHRDHLVCRAENGYWLAFCGESLQAPRWPVGEGAGLE